MISELWKELDVVLNEMEPLKVKEREIRAKIKQEQDRKYLEIMEPKLNRMSESHPGYENVSKHIAYLQGIR